MRTQTEIVTRMKDPSHQDIFGFGQEVLLDALDFEHAKEFLKPEVTEAAWNERERGVLGGKTFRGSFKTDEEVRTSALDYLAFAWGKAQDHRGISANRSVLKMTNYCWLLGLDVDRIEQAEYAMYGCPKLKVISELLGAPLPEDKELQRMMEGLPCTDWCTAGCGS